MAFLHMRAGRLLCLALVSLSQTKAAFAEDLGPSQLVATALEHRAVVKSARLRLEAARQSYRNAGAYPATRMDTGFASHPDVGGGEDLTLYQPLDVFGKSRASARVAWGNVLTAEAGYRQTSLDIQTEALNAFATWVSAKEELEIATDQVAIAQRVDQAAEARLRAESLSQIQRERAALDLRRSEAQIASKEAGLQVAEARLRFASGGSNLASLPVATLDPSLLQTARLEQDHPELLSLAAALQSAKAAAAQAQRSRLPDLEIQARRTPWGDPEQYGARLQLSFPVFDHGASNASYRSALAEANAASAAFLDTRRRIETDIACNQLLIVAAVKTLSQATSNREANERFFERATHGFELGVVPLLDVLDAKRSLLDSRTEESDARLSLSSAVIAALQAQGQLLAPEPKDGRK